MICYLIRHGKDDDRVRGGWSPTPLSEQGISEVQQLADHLAADPSFNIVRIFSSDLLRARQTAEIISSKLHIGVEYLPQFRETNNGILAGMNNHIATERYPGLFWNTLEWDERYPDGESPHQFFDRISNAWKTLKENMCDIDGNIVLVTHGGVINVIYHIEHGIPYSNKSKPLSIKSAGLIAFDVAPSRIKS